MTSFVGRKDRLPFTFAQSGDDLGVATANTDVDLQRIEAQIKQDAASILSAQRIGIRTDLRQFRAAIHGATGSREAEGNAVIPRFLGRRFRCDRPQFGACNNADPAARRNAAHATMVSNERYRLVCVARKLGDGSECAKAETGLGLGELADKKSDQLFARQHALPRILCAI